MMRRFLFLLLTITSPLHADDIKIAADPWCPFTCEPNTSMPGFMIEIAEEAFKNSGHKIIYSKLSWARALTDARNGIINAAVGAARREVPGFILPKKAIGTALNYFFTLPNDSWTFTDEKSLGKKTFAIINGYSYGSAIDDIIAKKHRGFKEISGEDPLLRMIQMTETKRVNGFIEDISVLAYKLQSLNKKADLFKISSQNLVANDPQLFIAFSPTNPKSKEYAKILDEGMIQLRKSGKLALILKKYSVKDWE